MNIEEKLTGSVINALKSLYGQEIASGQIQLQKTKKEFEGHLTLVVFPFLRLSKKRTGTNRTRNRRIPTSERTGCSQL